MGGMTPDYAQFLAGKAPRPQAVGIEPGPMPGHLFDFQQDVVRFLLRVGRGAGFLDTGLGKGRTALECLRQAGEIVLSPFMGIGSEGVVSVKRGRKFLGCELKPEYFTQACRALRAAERNAVDLFAA